MKNKFLLNLAPFKSRSFLLLVSLILICYSACKKEHYPPQLSSTSIKDPFIASLAEKLSTYDKSFIDSINQLGKIDWTKVIVRHTSSGEMPVNFILPIIKGDQPCNQVIEFGFSKDKKFVKATIRKLETAVLSTSSSNKQMITEQERTEHILYHFSQRGVRVSNSIIEAEHQRAQLYTLNKKNVLKSPSVGKQNNSIDNPPPINYCQTQLIFDFYISYHIEVDGSGSSSDYDGAYSKWIEGMEPSTIQFEISNYFFAYLMSNYIPYLTDQSSSYTNALFIYNMDDTNGQLGYFIQDALQHAMQQVQMEYAPQMWSIGLSYFNYSTRSNCNGSTTADGGWVDTRNGADAPVFEIINKVKDPCLHNMVDAILNDNGKGDINALIQHVFGTTSTLNFTITDQVIMTNSGDDGEESPLKDSNGALIGAEIYLNPGTLSNSSQEFIAATILHEGVHAYLDYQGIDIGAPQHELMAKDYLDDMAGDLQTMFPGMSDQIAYSLAWGGLENTYLYNNPGLVNCPGYQLEINTLYRAHTDGQGHFYGHGC
ncbi:hypothetical protein [Mucilaginibacter paludis]|uniref:Uncharacterized protein n=1 Tax=Mucilaginibacter paludis DSM 18603 TaxID=714943 RepID=H1YHZ1_9SPHI|nr:hypothetical protein [Mucilaginibacter paludis]EHQ25539.1 hypothetical protein Mucpa_1379 [Mucilaginibacter paludis DSM 18603]